MHIYLSFKEPQMISLHKRDYTLSTVLIALKKVIIRERQYHPLNTTCLICSSELEWVLGMKFLHVTEMHDAVLRQMVAIEPPSNNAISQDQEKPGSNKSPFNVEATYLVKPRFLKVLHQVPGVKLTKRVLSTKK